MCYCCRFADQLLQYPDVFKSAAGTTHIEITLADDLNDLQKRSAAVSGKS